VTVQAWFSGGDLDVEPGEAIVLPLTVTNLGSTTESFTLNPAGLAAAWTTIRPAYITLFGGSQQIVDVEVRPPRLPGTTAGPTSLGVRVVPQSDPDDVETVETTLHVAEVFDRRVEVLQPALRSRRRATYEVMIENHGNVHASCRLHLVDPTSRVDGDFDPPAIGVEPGGSAVARLKLRAERRQWERRSRSIPFRVDADQQGAPTAEARATFVQAPVFPERLWWRLAGVLVLVGAGAAAWLGLVLPAIDDAVDEAVADQVVVAPVSTDPVGAPAPTTVPAVPAEPEEPGSAFTTRLLPGAAIGQQRKQEFTVPDGSTLEVTDVFVQNTYGDEGTARLRLGSLLVGEWDLVNLDGIDASRQFVTPVVVLPGETVSFEVTCASIGQVGGETCTPSAVISGRLVPVSTTPEG
jgi:hypothetical protein